MSEINIPVEAVQYLGFIQVLLYFIAATCIGLAAVCVTILFGDG